MRFALLFTALLLPTTLMGATLPLLSRYVAAGQASGTNAAVGRLYAANTAGAVLGTLLAGFWLLPAIGLHATNLAACTIGLLLCAVVASFGRARLAPGSGAPSPDASETAADRRAARLVLAGFAMAGMASMVDEVAWTRALVQVVGPSTYAFSVMLAVFLAGIALGSAVATRLLPRIARPRLWLGLVEAFAGGCTLLAVVSFEPVQILYRALTGAGPGGRGPLYSGNEDPRCGNSARAHDALPGRRISPGHSGVGAHRRQRKPACRRVVWEQHLWLHSGVCRSRVLHDPGLGN